MTGTVNTVNHDPAAWLRQRANSYADDVARLRQHGGDRDEILLYEAIRDELRACAQAYEDGAP